MTVEQDDDLGEIKNGNQVHIKPQLIKMKARSGVKIDFDISFKPAKDYPLDVYFLMDISYTMNKNMADLKEQAIDLYSDLSSYTNNVRLGIGSFVEKPGVPLVDPTRNKSHSFKNEVPLTNNMETFKTQIDNIEFGYNFDEPEAGLDALMQAMKCQEQVGWRKKARRIIVLCTDSTYHSAGDGKIVGAIKPHDMQCHLENNVYSEALTYDYPSVSQINKVAADGNYRIIFAITNNKLLNNTPEVEYRELAKQIAGAKYAKLEGGNSVINIIKEAYEELANSAELKIQAPYFVEVTTDQECKSDPKINCESHHNQTVNIAGALKVKSCPPNDVMNQTFEVQIGFVSVPDKLVIQLEAECTCDCEKAEGVITPDKCHGAGFLQCGICKCQEVRYGVDCRCNGSSTDMEKCKLHPGDSKFCSGRGKCRCGKCEACMEGFSGDFCQFDDNSCPRPKNNPCSGHGICQRGQCHCYSHWTGSDCSCPDNDEACFIQKELTVAAGSAVGLVLLIGILTVIIWKILVILVHDKKEYEKFSSQASAQGFDVSQNPLYQDPSINFSNPVYNNQCN